MPGGRIVEKRRTCTKRDPLPRPYVLKPVNEGSSVGRRDRHRREQLRQSRSAATSTGPWQEFDQLLAEPFIRGRELTTAVLGGPGADWSPNSCPRSGFYDFDAKYTDGMTEHVCPAEDPRRDHRAVHGLCAARRIGCSAAGAPAVPISAGTTNRAEAGLFLLEVNTQPGMTPLSLVPEQAKYCGMDYGDLVEAIVAEALASYAAKAAGEAAMSQTIKRKRQRRPPGRGGARHGAAGQQGAGPDRLVRRYADAAGCPSPRNSCTASSWRLSWAAALRWHGSWPAWPAFRRWRSQQIASLAADAGFEVRRVEVRGVQRMNELKVYERVLGERDRAMPLVDLDALRARLAATELGRRMRAFRASCRIRW